MSWLAVKTFFKKACATVIKYWHYFALVAYTIAVYALLKKNKNTESIKQAFKLSKKAHKEEIDEINSSVDDEIVAAAEFAGNSPFPVPEDLYKGVYNE